MNLVLGVMLISVVPACSSLKQESAITLAYNTLKSVELDVTAALNTKGILYRQGKVTEEQDAEIKVVYERYQVAMLSAIQASSFNYDAPAPEIVLSLSNEIINLVNKLYL